MPTRAHLIIAGLEAAIGEITPDAKATSSDVFSRMDAPDDGELFQRDRAFVIFPVGVAEVDDTFIGGSTPHHAGFTLQISVGYARTAYVTDRILQDSERIIEAVEKYRTQNSNNIVSLDSVGNDIAPFETGLVIELTYRAVYALDLST